MKIKTDKLFKTAILIMCILLCLYFCFYTYFLRHIWENNGRAWDDVWRVSFTFVSSLVIIFGVAIILNDE